MSKPMMMFFRLTKVDEAKREVWGRATQEVVDKSGEIFDYESSKPYFKAWSDGFAKDTGGKSLGNIRSMHGKTAAGKVISIDFNDAEKAIDIGTKIVDDNEWEKVLEGVHTGFSIGGAYVKRWDDPKAGAKRFTADPAEISIVDSPCVPTAKFFDVVKADGAVEQRAFHDSYADLAKWAGEEIFDAACAVDALQTIFQLLLKESQEPGEDPAQVEALGQAVEALRVFIASEIKENNGDSPALKAAALEALRKVARRKDVNPKEGENEYGDVAFADAKNKKYPIDTAEHIRAAWNYISKPKNAEEYSAEDQRAIRARIVAAWKKKIDPQGPPSAADGKEAAMTADQLAKAAAALEDLHHSLKGAVADHKEAMAKAAGAHDELHGKVKKAMKGLKEAMGQEPEKEEPEAAKVQGGDLQKALDAKGAELAKAQDDLKKAQAEIEDLKKRPVMSPAEKAFLEAHATEITKGEDGTPAPKAKPEEDLSKISDPLAMSKALNQRGIPFQLK